MVCVFIPENTAAAASAELSFAIAIQITLEHFLQGFKNQIMQKYKAGKNVTDTTTFCKPVDLTSRWHFYKSLLPQVFMPLLFKHLGLSLAPLTWA